MKKIILAATVIGVLTLGLGLVSAAPANFGGTWVLDKAKSEGLQGAMATAEVTYVVTQNDKQLSYEPKIVVDGQARPSQALAFNLDGSETTAELTGRMTGKATRKAKWTSEKILELTDLRDLNFQGNAVQVKVVDHWELADEGKTLKVHRTTESPQGSQQVKLTFAKK